MPRPLDVDYWPMKAQTKGRNRTEILEAQNALDHCP